MSEADDTAKTRSDPARWRVWTGRVLRWSARALGVALGLLVVVLLVLGFVRSAREAVLDRVLRTVEGSLPGDLSVRAQWPGPGTLAFADLRWTEAGDTLAVADSLGVRLDLGAAVGRRLRVRELHLSRARLDLDAITRVMGAASADSAVAPPPADSTAAVGVTLPWFGSGRWQTLPDAALERLRIRSVRVRSAGRDYVLDRFEGHVHLGEDAPSPWLQLDLHAHAPGLVALRWEFASTVDDSLRFTFSPVHVAASPSARTDTTAVEEGVASTVPDAPDRWLRGEGTGLRWDGAVLTGEAGRLGSAGRWDAGEGRARLDFDAPADTTVLARAVALAGVDSLPMVRRLLSTWPDAGDGSGTYSLRLRADGSLDAFSTSGDVDLPGPTALVDPEQLPLALGDYRRLAGSVDLRRRADGTLDLDLSLAESPWLQRGRVVGSWDGARARVDTLDLAREGLLLVGSGRFDADRVDADLRFEVDSEGLAGIRAATTTMDSQLAFSARGRASASGTWPLPDLRLELQGSARGSFGEVPALTVRAVHDSTTTEAVVGLDEPATIAGQEVQTARLRWKGGLRTDANEIDGRASVAFSTGDLGLRLASAVHVSGRGGVFADLDTLRLDAVGARWEAARPFRVSADTVGTIRVEGLDLRGDLGTLRLDAVSSRDSLATDLDADLVLVREVLQAALPDSLHVLVPADTTRLSLRLRTEGPLTSPSAEAHLRIGLEGEERLGPLSAQADLWLRAEGALPLAGAPEDLAARGVALELDVRHAERSWIDASARLSGALNLDELGFERAPDDTARVDVRADSVDVVEVLDLAGIDASIRGLFDGRMVADLTEDRGLADVDLQVRGFALRQPDGEWWESDVALRLDGSGEFDGEVRVDSLRLQTSLGSITGSGRYLEDEVELALRTDLAVPRRMIDALTAQAATVYELPADTLGVRLQLRADGPVAAPSAWMDLDARLRGGDDLPPLDLRGQVWLRGEREGPWPSTPPDSLPSTGALARLRLLEADQEWVELSAMVPLRLGVRPVAFEAIEGEPLSLLFDTGELRVRRVAALAGLDRYGDFEGDLRMRLGARSDDGRTLTLDGSIVSDRLRAELVDGSWVQAHADVHFGGTSEQPSVDGGVTIEGGVLRVPEVPPSLHPTSGQALLWRERPVVPGDSLAVTGSAAVGDSTVVASAGADSTGAGAGATGNGGSASADSFAVAEGGLPEVGSGDDDDPRALLPDVDVRLDIPGSVRLQGMGLDIELSGQLDARTESGELGIVGTLQATRGSYQFLGRRFEVRTGRVSFYGDLNPELDLRLATTLQSTTYFVQISGSAQQPRFALSSDPEMSEGDIVSALLFGRPLDELDEGQTELLRQRTQQIAAQLGANLLAQRVGQQVGVDILSIRTAPGGEGQSLVVGKYLSPDVLVQYEQVLEEGAAALVRLEYALNRFFRIETTASQGDHSGVELKWSKDY